MLDSLSSAELLSYFYCNYQGGLCKATRQNIQTCIHPWNAKSIDHIEIQHHMDVLWNSLEAIWTDDTDINILNQLIYYIEGWHKVATTTEDIPNYESVEIQAHEMFSNGGLIASLAYASRMLYIINSCKKYNKKHHFRFQAILTIMYHIVVCNSNSVKLSQQLSSPVGNIVFAGLLESLVYCREPCDFPFKRVLLLIFAWLQAALGAQGVVNTLHRDSLLQTHAHVESTKFILENPMQFKCHPKQYDEIYAKQSEDFKSRKCWEDREQLLKSHFYCRYDELVPNPCDGMIEVENLADWTSDQYYEYSGKHYNIIIDQLGHLILLLKDALVVCCSSTMVAKDSHAAFISRTPLQDAKPGSSYWNWIKRERSITIEIIVQLILLMYQRFKMNNYYKGQSIQLAIIDSNVLVVLLKFLNKDLILYARQVEADKRFLVVGKLPQYDLSFCRSVRAIIKIIRTVCKRKDALIVKYLVEPNAIVLLQVLSF